MPNKTEQLQIRVSADQKARIKALAARAGQGVSEYVLARALPPAPDLDGFVAAVGDAQERSYALAALHDWLSQASPSEFLASTGSLDVAGLDPVWQNYIAALVEQAAVLKAVRPPSWVDETPELEYPWFAVSWPKLHPHLLKSSPAAFKRRNLFVETGLGARV